MNPNAFSLPIDGFNGGIRLNDLDIGKFSAKTKQSLAAKEVQTITLPITLDAEAFGRAARSVFSQGVAIYNFSGGVDTSVGQVPFSQDGELSIQDIIAKLMPSFGF
ncbi:MAG: LEA type 2 family protein [Ghiorsea sp.]